MFARGLDWDFVRLERNFILANRSIGLAVRMEAGQLACECFVGEFAASGLIS